MTVVKPRLLLKLPYASGCGLMVEWCTPAIERTSGLYSDSVLTGHVLSTRSAASV